MSRRWFNFKAEPRRRRALILACILFWSIISYLLISHYAVGAGEVVGISMRPTLEDGERYLINRWIFRLRDPLPGEIVALHVYQEQGLSVKRVIALPEELVKIGEGSVYVNGKKLREPYLGPAVRTLGNGMSEKTYKVAEDCYFVLGDNRSESEDSRIFGAVPRSWIGGRVEVPEKANGYLRSSPRPL